jgi:GT2 family glycosyltransferase
MKLEPNFFQAIDIIIVNWNSGLQLRECLESIVAHGKDCVKEVIIVDNNSVDDSLETIESINLPISIIRNTINRGFAAACNQGASMASSNYLLFLNPDTRLFENSLSIPLAFMEQPENNEVGIVGIQLIDENKQISQSCSRFPTMKIFLAHALGINRLPSLSHLSQLMIEWDHTSTRQVDQVMGAFFLIRHSIFVSLSGFDERFFVYFEEVDLSLRAHQAGWRSVYLTDAQAFHAGGGTSRQVKAKRLFYSLRSRLFYAFKHFPSMQAWVLVAVTLILEPITRTLFSLLRGGLHESLNTRQGYGMLYRNLWKIFNQNRATR